MATAVHKKQTESKYVSCFADSRGDVDITFRDVLLQRPTDHYLVGIDNFSMTNTSLSMIEPMTGNYAAFLRIVRNPSATMVQHVTTADIASGAECDTAFLTNGVSQPLAKKLYIGAADPVIAADAGFDFSLRSDVVILNLQQLLYRLNLIAADVNKYMSEGRCTSTHYELGYVPTTAEATVVHEHLKFLIGTSGQVQVQATAAFWANFSIELPAVRNQFAFYGGGNVILGPVPFTGLRRFLSVHAETGEPSFNKILVNRFPKKVKTKKEQGDLTNAELATEQAAARAYNSRTIAGSNPQVLADADAFSAGVDAQIASGSHPKSQNRLSVFLPACLFSSLERRVALEVGCSLPVKNSPMIDHQRESPDFVLARWIWRTDPRIESNEFGGSRRFHGAMPSCTEYQGSQDRISYHELQAQAKIQTLRIRLFARLRTFDENTETWGMRVIALPSTPTDWWHARIHFISKD